MAMVTVMVRSRHRFMVRVRVWVSVSFMNVAAGHFSKRHGTPVTHTVPRKYLLPFIPRPIPDQCANFWRYTNSVVFPLYPC